MDVRQLTRLIGFAAKGSLILLGSTAVLAGNRSLEQPTRPHMSAVCAPNWGFNQTCWSRFPALQGCPASGYDSMPEGYENHPSQQMLYTPQKSFLPDSQIVSPESGFSQAPISVFPNSSPAVQDATSGEKPAMSPAMRLPPSAIQQFGPSQSPEVQPIPDARSLPGSLIPGASSTLPPLPAPPLPAPGQSSLQPNIIIGPNRQLIIRPATASSSTFQANQHPAHSTPTSSVGSRYGNAWLAQQMPAVQPMPFTAQVYAAPYDIMVDANEPGMANVPVSRVSQSRVLPNAAGQSSYRSGRSMPPVSEAVRSVFQPTQLPLMPIYPTIPIEPSRSSR